MHLVVAVRAAAAGLLALLRCRNAVAVAVVVARMRVAVVVAAQDDEDEDVDAHADERQDEHHCGTERACVLCVSEVTTTGALLGLHERRGLHACMRMEARPCPVQQPGMLAGRSSGVKRLPTAASEEHSIRPPLPSTGEGWRMRLIASYSRMPVTSQVLSTDASAPSTSIRWYLSQGRPHQQDVSATNAAPAPSAHAQHCLI